jgi:hypothetical protein
MKSKFELLRESSMMPRPAHVSPGDPVFVPSMGKGRVTAVTAGSCWIHFDKTVDDSGQSSSTWTSTAALIADLEWRDGRWYMEPNKLGSSGDGPGAERFWGALPPGQ